jgi:molybdopterin converting factor small subunit
MATMERKVTATYYGMLAEKIGKQQENLQLPSGEIELREFFVDLYPELTNHTFSIAVDLNYTTTLLESSEPQKIDIMPPFAGG